MTTSGFVAAVIYSSACEALPPAGRPLATLLVNLGMTAGMWSGPRLFPRTFAPMVCL